MSVSGVFPDKEVSLLIQAMSSSAAVAGSPPVATVFVLCVCT